MNAIVSNAVRTCLLAGALAVCSGLQAAPGNWSPPRTADGRPVLAGVWTNASVTNLTRPPGVTKLVVSRAEAEALVKANPFQRLIEADNGPSDLNDNLLEDKNADRGYNAFWVDPGNFLASINGEYRTSWIVEPANGQMPLSDAGKQLLKEARAARDAALFHGPEALPLAERCLIAFSGASGPGMLNPMYNNNYQIVQTPQAVLILVEMVHDARIIPISKDKATAQASHRPASLALWFGDPVAWWEGDTLVVETTNFTDKVPYRGSSQDLKLIERFAPRAPGVVEWSVTFDDQATWTRPWTFAMNLTRTTERPFEYACHEGNYAMRNMLSIAREEEKAAGR
jgi:hypothetical protein